MGQQYIGKKIEDSSGNTVLIQFKIEVGTMTFYTGLCSSHKVGNNKELSSISIIYSEIGSILIHDAEQVGATTTPSGFDPAKLLTP